jgi:two-component system, OmpR family, alkaline phosphatase synthesis response regulator PhoP
LKKILIIEDDPALLAGISESLTNENYLVTRAEEGLKGYTLAAESDFDLILLDLILPLKDGFEVCRDLRGAGKNTPIIMLTSKNEEIDKVLGLEMGADDYMTKPFSLKELLARIKALLRRAEPAKPDIEEYSFGNITMNLKKMEIEKAGVPLKLSATEYKILKYLIEHEGEVITRDKFLDDVWGYDAFPTTRTVDNYILSLRKKIEDNPAEPEHIVTVHTAGYKFIK